MAAAKEGVMGEEAGTEEEKVEEMGMVEAVAKVEEVGMVEGAKEAAEAIVAAVAAVALEGLDMCYGHQAMRGILARGIEGQ